MKYITVSQYVKIKKISMFEHLDNLGGAKAWLKITKLPSLKGKRFDIIPNKKLV